MQLDPTLSGPAQLVYSTLLGGPYGSDHAEGLFVDASGLITITGTTYANSFPTTARAFRRTRNGFSNVFVAQLDPSRTGQSQLRYSTLLGHSGIDEGKDVAVDANGLVTIVGHTDSRRFPTTATAYERTHYGLRDAFVARLDSAHNWQGAAPVLDVARAHGRRRELEDRLAPDGSRDGPGRDQLGVFSHDHRCVLDGPVWSD